MTHARIGIRVALFTALCGCMDLDLLDDLVPADAGAAELGGEGDADADADGDTGGGGPPDTDSADVAAPAIIGATCASSELAVGDACVAGGRRAISLRFATDEPAAIAVSPPAGIRAEVLSDPWSVEHLVAAVGVGAEAAVELLIELADVNGNTGESAFPVTALEGPSVAITEVLADPLGEEPAQEFVEIANFGDTQVDLSGWMIDDGGDYNGDALPAGTVLGPGVVALLVAPSFDPASAEDPAPADTALLVVLESSIGTSGLANSSVESIELYDAYGALVSAYDGRLGEPVEAGSAARIRAELPDGCPLAFGAESQRPATPGSAEFIP